MLKVRAERFGGVTILHLQGRIVNGPETETLRKTVMAQKSASAMLLDLARVSSIDAAGLGVLLELRQWTQTEGIEFRLINVNQLIQQVLEITRLDSVFEVASPRTWVRVSTLQERKFFHGKTD